VVLDWQVDEPEVPAEAVQRLIDAIPSTYSETINTRAFFEPRIATLAAPLNPGDRENPNVVKVVIDDHGNALYFTRAAVPHAYRHVGIYAFTRDALTESAALPESDIGKAEHLEQLDWLASGMLIKVVLCDHPYRGIDTEDDYREYVARFRSRELAEREAVACEAGSEAGGVAKTVCRESGDASRVEGSMAREGIQPPKPAKPPICKSWAGWRY
jgi:CMP-2-keto-3-deoxyoctulosonic acid synthetase